MKTLALLIMGLAGKVLLADQVVVFDAKDFYVLDRIPVPAGPSEPDRLAFFDACRSDMAAHTPLDKTRDLVAPGAWGTVLSPSTRGTIQFHPVFPGGLVCHLTLSGLEPVHRYILTLNGGIDKPGNGLLPVPVPGNGRERYYDFLFVTSDASGRYDSEIGVFLKASRYDVRCFVKDTLDFKVVLSLDSFEFEVR